MTIHFTPKEVANYFVVYVADVFDQFSDVTSYNMVYTPGYDANKKPVRIWPGTGKPGMVTVMYWEWHFSVGCCTLQGITWTTSPAVFPITALVFSMRKTNAKLGIYIGTQGDTNLTKSDEELEKMCFRSAQLTLGWRRHTLCCLN